MFWMWLAGLIIGIILDSELLVVTSIICVNIHYVADEIIKRIEKAAK